MGDEANRVPSVLNGGMGKISPFFWGISIVLAAAVDIYGLTAHPTKKGAFSIPIPESKQKGYFPGNLGFDPFGLYPKEEAQQKWMQTAEIKNGRLAMIAITGFAFQEFFTHVAVVNETPFFFQPIWETLGYHFIPPQDAYVIFETDTPPLDTAVTTP